MRVTGTRASRRRPGRAQRLLGQSESRASCSQRVALAARDRRRARASPSLARRCSEALLLERGAPREACRPDRTRGSTPATAGEEGPVGSASGEADPPRGRNGRRGEAKTAPERGSEHAPAGPRGAALQATLVERKRKASEEERDDVVTPWTTTTTTPAWSPEAKRMKRRRATRPREHFGEHADGVRRGRRVDRQSPGAVE